ARRPTLELILATLAEEEPRVTVRRGVEVAGLTARASGGRPHVTGIRTATGSELSADLVVDATGRGSRLPRWLRDIDAGPVPEESEDCGFIYYPRFFRSRDGSHPEPRTPALLTPVGSFSLLTLFGDCGTWSVTIYISSGDQPLKRLRHAEPWQAV